MSTRDTLTRAEVIETAARAEMCAEATLPGRLIRGLCDLALSRPSLDSATVEAAKDKARLDWWGGDIRNAIDRAMAEGKPARALASTEHAQKRDGVAEGARSLGSQPSPSTEHAAPQENDCRRSSEIGMDNLQRPGLANSETSGKGSLHVERQLSKLEVGGSHVTPGGNHSPGAAPHSMEGGEPAYTVPNDPARAVESFLSKLNAEDKNTFNWCLAFAKQVARADVEINQPLPADSKLAEELAKQIVGRDGYCLVSADLLGRAADALRSKAKGD